MAKRKHILSGILALLFVLAMACCHSKKQQDKPPITTTVPTRAATKSTGQNTASSDTPTEQIPPATSQSQGETAQTEEAKPTQPPADVTPEYKPTAPVDNTPVETEPVKTEPLPTQPLEPKAPAQPTEPEVHTQPTQPIEHEMPIQPTEPAEPVAPALPTEPAAPTQPTEPTQPAAWEEPTHPTEIEGCRHEWVCVYHAAQGHWVAGVLCDCGWTVYGRIEELNDLWNAHSAAYPPMEALLSHGGYASIDEWVSDAPAYEEWSCAICGKPKE